MESNVEIGAAGERIAKDYLIQLGYDFQTANYRFQHLEIDLIFIHENQLVVVEVKSRNTTIYGEPYEAVTRTKQNQIIRATNQYILENGLDLDVRFDVISIVFKENYEYELAHIIDAFVP